MKDGENIFSFVFAPTLLLLCRAIRPGTSGTLCRHNLLYLGLGLSAGIRKGRRRVLALESALRKLPQLLIERSVEEGSGLEGGSSFKARHSGEAGRGWELRQTHLEKYRK